MTKIELYIRNRNQPVCRYCENAKQYLANRTDVETVIYEVGVDLTRDELLEKFPEVQTYPVVVVDGKWIGGYTDMVNANI